jgi:phosphoribosylanthranilate isomerase
MRIRIKICCISSIEEAKLAVDAGADALGLVARMPSGPGVISDELIRQIALETPPPVATFLLTQETSGDKIAEHAAFCAVNTVQVVNHIDPGEYRRIVDRAPHLRRVQVIHVEDAGALDRIAAYAPYVHAFLLDSGRPSAAVPELGGTGRRHDWEISRRFVQLSPHPVFLAGGLAPENVAEAIAQVNPFGLDVCSGLRTEGRLDPAKLNRYLRVISDSGWRQDRAD